MKQKLQLLPSRIRLLLGIMGVFFCAGRAQAQTTLAPGDLVITSFNASQAASLDSFSFVLLANISSGTTIRFTDQSYNGSAWQLNGNDAAISWTSNSAFAAGTEIVIANLSSSYVASTGVGAGTVTALPMFIPAQGSNTSMSLSANGDQIIAYQGSGFVSDAGATIIFAFHYGWCPQGIGTTDANWDASTCTGQASSSRPSGTTVGTTAFWTGLVTTNTPPSSAKFNGTGVPAANAAAVRTAVNNSANWTKQSGSGTLGVPTGFTYLSSTPVITDQPDPQTICANAGTSFSVTATGATSYQWQVSTTGTGGTYNNVSGATYSGANTNTLTLTNVPASFNGYAYRCAVTNASGTINSNGALLTVNSTPSISSQPGDETNCPGSNSSFSVTAGGGALSYQWEVNTGSGFSNVPASAPYSGTTSATLTLANPSSTMYGYQYRVVVSNSCGSTTSNAVTLRFSTTWTGGASSTAWNTAGNWNCGVPSQNVDAVVNSGPVFMPTVNAAASCRNLSIGSGATLTVGTNNTLSIYGSVTNSGTFNANNAGATVAFASASTQNVPGGNYRNLTISGGGDKNLGGSATLSGTLTLSSGKLLLGANTLTTSSAVSGYNATNYIVTNGTGTLTINNIGPGGLTGAVFFPVGTASSYTPAAISNTGVLDNFSVRTIAGVYADYSGHVPIGAPITSNVVNSTWFVSEAVDGGSDVSLTAQWNASNELFGFVRTAVTLSHYTGSGWDPMTLTGAGGGGPYFVTRNDISTFSPFGVGNFNSALPVTWKSFSGRAQGRSAILDWTVADEKNVLRYEVQRSENGREFSGIGMVKAQGEAGMNAYTFTDGNISAPAYYYRIRMIETSGASSFSSVVRVAMRAEDKVRLLSNPVTENISLELNALEDGNVTVLITDLNGRKQLAQTVVVRPGSQVVSIPAASLAAGQVYFLKVQGSLGSHVFKMVK